MYEAPSDYKSLIKAIDNAPQTLGAGKTLVNVETTLYLAEILGFGDEPITLGWVLLCGTPTPGDYLNHLTAEQRHMIANARQLISLESRFAWESELRQYARIPAEHRNYSKIVAANLAEQMIESSKADSLPHPEYLDIYRQMLTASLRFERESPLHPKAKETYTFTVSADGVQHGRVRFEDEHIAYLDIHKPLFDEHRTRQPLSIPFADLTETAQFLDSHEPFPHWVEDLSRIRFRRVDGVGTQAHLYTPNTLEIDGFLHMAGIVSSGKTTLAILIAAHAILHNWTLRITFVVGDTNTAVQLAHRFNTWFRSDPATDIPVAVPILGQSTRKIHLERLLVSREYRDAKARGQPHWGERWLSPVCPLEALVQWDNDTMKGMPIGKEPCQRLQKSASTNTKRVKSHICPLFAICPSKQAYRDMPDANLWITTPGALAQSAVPRHLENRKIKLGELVYEQSDLVIFDEAETVVDWFDRVYAHNQVLTDGGTGLLDRLDREIGAYLTTHRATSASFQRWLFAERAALKAITVILTILDSTQGQGLERLREWIKTGQFTRNSLSYRLARRLAGLKEFERRDDLPLEQQRREEEQTQTVLRYFEALNGIENPFERQTAPSDSRPEQQGAYALTDIMQQMNSAGQDIDTLVLIGLCKGWIERFFPEIERQIAALRIRLVESRNKADRIYIAEDRLDRNTDDLALRLFFTLWAVILDWHLDIVFHEWYRKPDEINIEAPYKIPRNLRSLLPLPATGAQFGLYRVPGQGEKTTPNRFTQFLYVNIGRFYILNFHRLRTDLDGLRGPNVLAMSGTSYLPASSRFNLQVPPGAVLSPDSRTQDGLKNSHFEFKPFYDENNQPISVSGMSQKPHHLRDMIQAMLKDDPQTGGFFGSVLAKLREHEQANSDQWGDRARLLLFTNSYDQAKVVAKALQNSWSGMAKRIFYLCRGKDNQDYEVELGDKIERVDIEQFAKKTDGCVLVAPMQSIGRGFNILNTQTPPLAAFGAVFFLIRPMWQPNELASMAQEVNRYTLDWAAQHNVPKAFERADGLYGNAIILRETARKLWRDIETRQSYSALSYPQADGSKVDLEPELLIMPRSDLAATTAGLIIQAVGRLLRGGVPFYAYFTDAAWAPKTAEGGQSVQETAETSLLQAMIDVINCYADPDDAVGSALYADLAESLSVTAGLNNN